MQNHALILSTGCIPCIRLPPPRVADCRICIPSSLQIRPQSPDHGATAATSVGFVTMLLLMLKGTKPFWWPFHRAGYAVSSSWSMNDFWVSVVLSFLAMWIILKTGGIKAHRQAIPFFLGLIFGESIVRSIWSIIGVCMHRPMDLFLH